jgi:hypothetical protein
MVAVYQKSFLAFYGMSFDNPTLETVTGALALGSGATAFATNILRIVLSACFMIVALYVRLLRPFIILIWGAIVRPVHALFSPPCIAAGALVVFAENLRGIVHTVADFARSLI